MIERTDVVEKLLEVMDPELDMNIVDLGLVYDIRLQPEDVVEIDISLTYPGCPLGPQIQEDILKKIKGHKGIAKVITTIVWEPAWEQGMMDEETQEELRFAGRIR